MLYEMRKKERQITREEAYALLRRGEYGVLSTVGEDGAPYGVPVSYAVEGDIIYFHCARGVGHKCANLAACPNVSFTVVGETQVLPERFSTAYESVIAFGQAAPAKDKKRGLLALAAKYSSGFAPQAEAYAQKALDAGTVEVYAIRIQTLTGKARRQC